MQSGNALIASQAGQGGGSYLGNAIPGLLQYFFGHSDEPYKARQKAFNPYYNEARGYQNPFFQAGTSAIPDFQKWLSGMQNPSGFINNLMGQYQESPWAHYQQQQAMRAANNMGSATGLTGSTPLQMQAQQNASNISSQDMNQWLQNVLGINTQYGAGQQGLMGMGQHAADWLSQMGMNAGEYAGGNAYGEEMGRGRDRSSLFDAIGSLFGGRR